MTMADFLTQRDLVREGLATLRTELDPDGTNPPDLAAGSDLATFVSVAAGMISPLLGHVAERAAARTLSGATSIEDVATLAKDVYHDSLKLAAPAGGSIYLRRGGSSATSIPKGSRFAVPASGSQAAVYFEADEDTPSSSTKVAVAVTCTEPGRQGNVSLADITKIVDKLPDDGWSLFVPSVVIPGPTGETTPEDFGGGADAETIDEAKARLSKVPSDASQKPGLLDGILFGVQRVPGVADVVPVAPGDGSAVLYVGDAQYSLPSKLKTAVEAAAAAWRCFGIPIRVRPFTVQTVVNTITVYMEQPLAEYDTATLRELATAAVLAYYAPGRPHPDEYVRSAIGSKVARAVGLEDVQSVAVSSPGSDQLRATDASYGAAGTINRYITDAAHVSITFAAPQTA